MTLNKDKKVCYHSAQPLLHFDTMLFSSYLVVNKVAIIISYKVLHNKEQKYTAWQGFVQMWPRSVWTIIK